MASQRKGKSSSRRTIKRKGYSSSFPRGGRSKEILESILSVPSLTTLRSISMCLHRPDVYGDQNISSYFDELVSYSRRFIKSTKKEKKKKETIKRRKLKERQSLKKIKWSLNFIITIDYYGRNDVTNTSRKLNYT